MRLLEKQNYLCLRMAGSHSPFDVFALLNSYHNPDDLSAIRAIQIKSGKSPIKKDLAKISKLKIPHIISRELWQFLPRKKPIVHKIEPA